MKGALPVQDPHLHPRVLASGQVDLNHGSHWQTCRHGPPFIFPHVTPHQVPGAKNYITKLMLKENLLSIFFSIFLILQLFQECLCCRGCQECLLQHPSTSLKEKKWTSDVVNVKSRGLCRRSGAFPFVMKTRGVHSFICPEVEHAAGAHLFWPCPPFSVCLEEAVKTGMVI